MGFDEPDELALCWCIPATPEALARMEETIARALYVNERRHEPQKMAWETTWDAVRDGYRKDARAALRSLGLSAPKKGGK